MRKVMPEIMLIVWAITLCGNVILALLLTGLRHYIRWGFLLLWTISSVAIDFIGWYGQYHHSINLYPQFWLFTRYAWTFVIEAVVIVEAFKWRERRVEYPVSAQLFLGIVGLVILHSLKYCWPVYYFECFTRLFNLSVIIYMLSIFAKEPQYD